MRKAIWDTDTQFNYGSPSLSNIEVSGTGAAALLRLIQIIDNGNIPYTNIADYTLSDAGKLDITGFAKLKAFIANEKNWDFNTAGDYTYDSAKIEVTGGKAMLKGYPMMPYADWHMNESSGNMVADSSGNGRNGTRVNMEDADWTAGKLNNCLTFDGVDEYVDCGNICNWEKTQAWSVECWFKTSANVQKFIAGKYAYGNGFNNAGWGVGFQTGGKIYIYLSKYPGNLGVMTVDGWNDNAWHHAVLTYDGSNTAAGCKIYLDAVLKTTTTLAENLTGSILNAVNFRIAARNADTSFTYYNGLMDEIVVYDRVLTPTEVTYRYNSGSGTEALNTYPLDNPAIYPNSGWAFSDPLGFFTETAAKPATTELKYHCSIDDGTTWKYWTGSAWAASDGTYAQASTAADVAAHIGSIENSGTLRFRALLHSETGNYTPEMDNLYVAETATYSTDDNLYIDTKDASQIKPARVYDWLTAAVTNSNPSGTDIRMLLSVDGRVTWKRWNGSAWVTSANPALRSEGNSIGEVEANIGTLSAGSGYLDIRLFLHTSDNTATPTVDNINVVSNGGYPASGIYVSTAYQPAVGTSGVFVENIVFEKTLAPGTAVKIEVQPVSSVLEDGYGEYQSGDTIRRSGNLIQWRATFTTTGQFTPTLGKVKIGFDVLTDLLEKNELGLWD